ncbi:MAG: DUF5689 domain-containing protein, partial [candidate division WOR-3 bacterium]|nr:DUF5689 domain-containing protein [candidate division WOR-3 bacterium]
PRVIIDGIRIGNSWGIVSGVEPPIITNIVRTPKNPLSGQQVTVTAKIYDDITPLSDIADTLFYKINNAATWNWILKDTYNPADSTFSYTIPAHSTFGDTVFYKIHATDGNGATTISSVYRYIIPFERTISEIQNNGPASADTNKYVYTKGIVTGTLGARFFIEENPGGAWHGLYVYRRAQDSLPKLQVGDSVGVWGIVKEYFTLTEIDAGYNLGGAVVVYAQNRPLPQISKINFSSVTEAYEGCLVRLDSVYFKEVGNFTGSTNYWLYSLTSADSVRVRIDAASALVGTPIPQETVALIANLSAYKDTFQLMPRTQADFLPYYYDVAVTEVLGPTGTIPWGVKVRPKAKFKNLGNLPSPSFRVVFNITESKLGEYTDTVMIATLQPNQEVTIEFEYYTVTGNVGTLYQTQAQVLINDRNSVNNILAGSGFEVGYSLVRIWFIQPDVPQALDLKPGKYVKDGGALVATNNTLYAFPGNKSWQFYKFTPTGVAWGDWTVCESIPYGFKYKYGVGIDSSGFNNKKIAKGAA